MKNKIATGFQGVFNQEGEMKKLSMLLTITLVLCFLISGAIAAEAPPPKVVFLNFDGDPNFPSLTTLRDTTGLAPFTGSAFRLSTEERDQVIQGVVDAVLANFKDFNIRFVTDPGLLSGG